MKTILKKMTDMFAGYLIRARNTAGFKEINKKTEIRAVTVYCIFGKTALNCEMLQEEIQTFCKR